MLLFCKERQRNVPKRITHVYSLRFARYKSFAGFVTLSFPSALSSRSSLYCLRKDPKIRNYAYIMFLFESHSEKEGKTPDEIGLR